MVLGWWFGWFSSCSCSSGLLWSLGKGESLTRVVVRPKKYIIIIIKKLMLHNYNNHVYIHDYYRKCLYLHIYTLTDMCSFEAKLCKFHYFSIYKHLCECYHIAKEGKLYEKLGQIAIWTRGHMSVS